MGSCSKYSASCSGGKSGSWDVMKDSKAIENAYQKYRRGKIAENEFTYNHGGHKYRVHFGKYRPQFFQDDENYDPPQKKANELRRVPIVKDDCKYKCRTCGENPVSSEGDKCSDCKRRPTRTYKCSVCGVTSVSRKGDKCSDCKRRPSTYKCSACGVTSVSREGDKCSDCQRRPAHKLSQCNAFSGNERCPSPRANDKTIYCEEHKCKFRGCPNQYTFDHKGRPQEYCKE